jgi:sugar phosphate isomerase/epimerase
MKRRTFLTTLAAAAAGGAKPGYAPIFAGQAYVFSQFYAREKQKLEDHFEDVFQAFQAAGYSTLELTSDFFAPVWVERTAGLLKRHKLKVPVVYNGGELHTEAGAEKTIAATAELARRVKKVAGALDAINVNPNPLPKKAPKTDAQLKVQAASLNRLAAELKREGVRLMLHQHDAEMADGAREWRSMLANTDAASVLVCLDTHWVYRGGQDVMSLLAEAAPRLAALHLRNSRGGVWLEELADGDVDYRAVAAFLKRTGFRGYAVVELAWDPQTEITRPLEADLRRSLQYAKSVFR